MTSVAADIRGETVPNFEGKGQVQLVSILIPCYGQLEYTRLCVPSVLRFSRAPFEVVFLEGGSLDGTAEYLAGVAAAARVPIHVVSVTPSPIPDAVNSQEAIVRARAEFIVLLSNDCIVSDRWLDHLVKLATVDPAVGMVAPMANYAPPAQRVESIPYRLGARSDVTCADSVEIAKQIEEVNRFASHWREKNRGQWQQAEQLGGGCVLIKRDVMKAVGLSLSRTPLGFFDVEALSQRVVKGGFRLACCKDLYIHNFGSKASHNK